MTACHRAIPKSILVYDMHIIIPLVRGMLDAQKVARPKLKNKKMNHLQSYDSDEEPIFGSKSPTKNTTLDINAAPNVTLSERKMYIVPKDTTALVYNPTYDELHAQKVGPKNPFATSQSKLDSGFKLNGEIDSHNMNSFLFNSQYYHYDITKKANLLPGAQFTETIAVEDNPEKKKRKVAAPVSSDENFVVVNEDDYSEVISGFDEDAFITDDNQEVQNQLLVSKLKEQHQEQLQRRKEKLAKETPVDENDAKKRKKEVGGVLPEIPFDSEVERKTITEGQDAYCVYHLPRNMDYQGRTFVVPPSHLKPCDFSEKRSVVPKKLIHTYTGHEQDKMVTAIEFFPKYGHLLLSASTDSTIKIWDVLTHRNCVQTYVGHTRSIKAIGFSSDGLNFASCSYDKKVRIWDTETGKVLQTFTSGATPYCVKWNTLEQKENEIIVGYSNSKIIQWDTRSGKITFKYDKHTGAVNSLCLVDGGKKFVSSSDDKSLRLWEFGIPAEIKKLSDTEMQSMPFLEAHPNGKWVIAQSLSNQILTFDALSRLKQQQNKIFSGHQVAGYSCQVGFSNDGKFVVSGDHVGNVWFWDWKEAKQIKKMQCHSGVCIGCTWHPLDRSLFATCGSDSTIKLFQ